jgi:hypothetical protein
MLITMFGRTDVTGEAKRSPFSQDVISVFNILADSVSLLLRCCGLDVLHKMPLTAFSRRNL